MFSKQEFKRLCDEGYTHIPLVKVATNFISPTDIYLKLAYQPYSYLLESAGDHSNQKGRYSIIGLPCSQHIQVSDNKVQVYDAGEMVTNEVCADPLAWIEQMSERFCTPHIQGLPRFTGGLVGYFGYDAIRYIEPCLAGRQKPNDLNVPDILLLVSEQLVVVDNLKKQVYLIANARAKTPDAYARAEQRLDELLTELTVAEPAHLDITGIPVSEADFVSSFPEADFKAAVSQTKQYIIDGDVMQVVLSQRLQASFQANPFAYYLSLRQLNPSPYMYYFNLDTFNIAGSSPEILVRVEGDTVTVRPIAGTRRRGKDEQEDRRMEQELLADEKELAEHLMLIDLGRNDIGRICETGSVRLTEQMIIERYSHVMHMVSNVTGKKHAATNLMDVLRATFPAGTLSGAPKVRALEIIDELEPVKRCVYSGAIGYISYTGVMDMAIAIRTALMKDNILYAQAGAGLVYDSQPDLEWQETMNKARALIRAATLVHSYENTDGRA